MTSIGHYSDLYSDSYGGSATGLASLGIQVSWDDAPLQYTPAVTWSPVGDDAQDLTITRGRTPSQTTYDTAVATCILDNAADASHVVEKYNPMNTAGPYFGRLTSYRPFRVIANDSTGTQRTMFRGHVQPRGWRNTAALPGNGTTTVTASDIFQMLARYDLPVTAPQGSGDHLDDRLTGVMTLAGVPALGGFYRFLAPFGSRGVILGDTTYGGKLKQYLELLALSDSGALWCDRDGVVVMEDRFVQFLDPACTTPQATFADDATSIAGGAIPFETITLDYASDVINQSRMTGVSGNTQDVSDGTIETLSGLANTNDQTIMVRDDTEAYGRAVLDVALHGKDWYGPVALTFEVTESAHALDAALNLDLRQRVRIKYTPPGLAQVTADCFIEEIVHTIPIHTSPNTWKVSYQFSPCAPFDALNASAWMRLDYGALDTATLAF